MSNDSVAKTVIVAFLLCVVCSIAVSISAVKLRRLQTEIKSSISKKNFY